MSKSSAACFCFVSTVVALTSACGPRYLIVPDRLTAAKKVAVMEYIVEGPVQYNYGDRQKNEPNTAELQGLIRRALPVSPSDGRRGRCPWIPR